MKQPITFAVCGFGIRGMEAYSSYQKRHPEQMRITAVADPDPERRQIAQTEYNVPAEHCYTSAEELLAQPRMADVMLLPHRTDSISSRRCRLWRKGIICSWKSRFRPVCRSASLCGKSP